MTNLSTNSSSKPSLIGRKRTKDLQQTLQPEAENPMNQVKKTLLDLQEDILSNSDSEGTSESKPKKSSATQEKEVLKTQAENNKPSIPEKIKPQSPAKAEAKTETKAVAPNIVENIRKTNEKTETKKTETKKTPLTPTGKMSRVTFEQEAFEYLLKFHQNLRNPHQAIRVSYSLSEQNRKFLDAIKKVINHYGESLSHSSLTQAEIMQKCQGLLDTLVSRLIREGVKLKPLTLTPDR
jgi:hypothetical protein